MTHGGFEISVVRPDPAEFWQQLWWTRHFVHWEKDLAKWGLLYEPVQGFFSSKAVAFLSTKQLFFFGRCRKLSASTFLSNTAPEVLGS